MNKPENKEWPNPKGWLDADIIPPPTDEGNLLVEDSYGGIANVFYKNGKWWLETFEQFKIELPGRIVYWIELPDPSNGKDIL